MYILEGSNFNFGEVRLWDLHIPREKWLNYLQTVETLIRCRRMWHLIWVCTVCQVPFYRYPDYNGLRGRDTLSKGVTPSSWNGPCSCDWGSWFAIYNEVGQTEWEISYHVWSKSATLCKVCLWCLFVCFIRVLRCFQQSSVIMMASGHGRELNAHF